MATQDASLSRTRTIRVIGALCMSPLSIFPSVYLQSRWPLLQNELARFGMGIPVFLTLVCIVWIIVARREFWPDFPMWRLFGWLSLWIVATVVLLRLLD